MNRIRELLKKKTTPVHILYGFISAFLCYAFGFLLGGAMMIGFAIWEYWNDENEMMRKVNNSEDYVYEGDWDFWESTLSFITGLVVLGILQVLGVISNVGWL